MTVGMARAKSPSIQDCNTILKFLINFNALFKIDFFFMFKREKKQGSCSYEEPTVVVADCAEKTVQAQVR